MLLKEALEIINDPEEEKGYLVKFEHKIKNAIYFPRYFPTDNEKPIETAEIAWRLAQKFAKNSKGKYVNIRIVDYQGKNIKGYNETIKNY